MTTEDLLPATLQLFRTFARTSADTGTGAVRNIGINVFHALKLENSTTVADEPNPGNHLLANELDFIDKANQPQGGEPELLAMCASSMVHYSVKVGGSTERGIQFALTYEFQCNDRVAALEVASETLIGPNYSCTTPEQRIALLPAQQATITFPYVNELVELVDSAAASAGYIQLTNGNQDTGDSEVYWWIDGKEEASQTIDLPVFKRDGENVVLMESPTPINFSLNNLMRVSSYVDTRYGISVSKRLELEEMYRMVIYLLDAVTENKEDNFTSAQLRLYAKTVGKDNAMPLDLSTISKVDSSMVQSVILPSLLRIINNSAVRQILEVALRQESRKGAHYVKPRVARELKLYVEAFKQTAVAYAELIGLKQGNVNYVQEIMSRMDNNMEGLLAVEVTDTLFGRRQERKL
jgi:hypothetical protein